MMRAKVMSSATVSLHQAARLSTGVPGSLFRTPVLVKFTSVLNLAPEPVLNLPAERCKEGSQECDDDGQALGPARNLDLERVLHHVGSGRLVGTWAPLSRENFRSAFPSPPLPSSPSHGTPRQRLKTRHRENNTTLACVRACVSSRRSLHHPTASDVTSLAPAHAQRKP